MFIPMFSNVLNFLNLQLQLLKLYLFNSDMENSKEKSKTDLEETLKTEDN